MAIFPLLSTERRELPLDALAARVGQELDALARLSADVQAALSLCDFTDHTDPGAIRALQGIDRITQALEDLSRLMTAVSSEMPNDVFVHAVPILSRLRLHELVRSLDPDIAKGQAAPIEPDGDIDWF